MKSRDVYREETYDLRSWFHGFQIKSDSCFPER